VLDTPVTLDHPSFDQSLDFQAIYEPAHWCRLDLQFFGKFRLASVSPVSRKRASHSNPI
jgi:hypothetical protein